MTHRDSQSIASFYNALAPTYEQHDDVLQEIAKRLCRRLSWIKCNPELIVDLGAGTGRTTEIIQTYFPEAAILLIDLRQFIGQNFMQPIESQLVRGSQ